MAGRITDPDVRILVGISETLRGDYTKEDDAWAGSPFAWIKSHVSRTRGKIGEQLVAGWCAAKGLDVTRATSSEHDRVIGGHKVEIKFSTLWKSGTYKFQQIRDQDYELAICLGVAPFDARCWAIPKDVLRAHVIGHTGQHGGSSGTDTAWISTPPDGLDWMQEWGGSLAEAFQVLQRLGD